MKIRYFSTAFFLSLFSLPSQAEDNTTYSTFTYENISQGSIEYFIEGKKGKGNKANIVTEDGLFYNDYYLAVFDGATDKSGEKYDGRKGGRVARDIIYSVFASLPKGLSPAEVVREINTSYQDFYKKYPNIDFKNNPLFRPTSTLVWYDLTNNTLASIGDSKARIDGKQYGETEKLVDVLNSELRSFTLKTLGLSEDEIKNKDWGREYILPLLKKQYDFQNNIDAPELFQYWAIDGFDVPEDKINVWHFSYLPNLIELSSDGYFYPKDSSIESYEELLFSVIKSDPLMMNEHKSTKGIKDGYVSFDDRAVLIFRKAK